VTNMGGLMGLLVSIAIIVAGIWVAKKLRVI
jgi:hypothetical protein